MNEQQIMNMFEKAVETDHVCMSLNKLYKKNVCNIKKHTLKKSRHATKLLPNIYSVETEMPYIDVYYVNGTMVVVHTKHERNALLNKIRQYTGVDAHKKRNVFVFPSINEFKNGFRFI